jgi:uncharacterized protein YndB with AHSA1/START domain
MAGKTRITINATINAPVEKVWKLWNEPEHIMQWNSASEDWHSPRAENDLRAGGSFNYRMEAKDGSFGFDFGGVYDEVIPNEHISYTMADGRGVSTEFTGNDNTTEITSTFEAESENPEEMQRQGWQAILDNFKKYAETN